MAQADFLFDNTVSSWAILPQGYLEIIW